MDFFSFVQEQGGWVEFFTGFGTWCLSSLDKLIARDGSNNWISFIGWIVALLTFLFSIRTYRRQKHRERRIELQENYLRLELESNSVFRYESDYGVELAAYRESGAPDFYRMLSEGTAPAESDEEHRERMRRESIADNFYLQQLNLFEIAARFRRDEVFAPEVFGSWVIWYYDVATSWWFRKKWNEEYSDNYTDDLYHIFTPMVQLFDQLLERMGSIPVSDTDDRSRDLKEIFFDHVAARFHCPAIKEWLQRENVAKKSQWHRMIYKSTRPLHRHIWKIRNSFRDTMHISAEAERKKQNLLESSKSARRSSKHFLAGRDTLFWTQSTNENAEAARFFTRVISQDPSYISHGEVQTGLSSDGKTWRPDLEERFMEDMAKIDNCRSVLLARDQQSRLIAAAIVYWETSERITFGILEDMAVDPDYRSAGLGARMTDFIDQEARRRGCRWMFLESGKSNRRAHAFFERQGYREISHVFAKPLN